MARCRNAIGKAHSKKSWNSDAIYTVYTRTRSSRYNSFTIARERGTASEAGRREHMKSSTERPEPTYTIAQLEAEPAAKFELPAFTRDDATRLGECTLAVIREWVGPLRI